MQVALAELEQVSPPAGQFLASRLIPYDGVTEIRAVVLEKAKQSMTRNFSNREVLEVNVLDDLVANRLEQFFAVEGRLRFLTREALDRLMAVVVRSAA